MGDSDTIRGVPGVVSRDDPRVPWWWNAFMAFFVKVALPVLLLCGFVGFLLWERVTVLKDQTRATETMTKTLERVVPVIERLERRLPE